MGVVLRPALDLSDEDDLIIHMGAGARRDVVRAAIRNYHAYEGIHGEPGAFTVSVFAAIAGVTEAEIIAALPQRQYGVTRYGKLRGRVPVWPTTITGTAIPSESWPSISIWYSPHRASTSLRARALRISMMLSWERSLPC